METVNALITGIVIGAVFGISVAGCINEYWRKSFHEHHEKWKAAYIELIEIKDKAYIRADIEREERKTNERQQRQKP